VSEPSSRARATRPFAIAVIAAAALAAFFVRPSRAPATITEQRNRLPPPAFCEDEVEGVWRAHYFWEGHDQWYVMTLEVRRDRRTHDRLTGVILAEFWDGGRETSEPPAQCGPGVEHRIVRQPAQGSIVDGFITFGGTSWQLDRTFCSGGAMAYNPDVFSGRIDPAIQEFQSVNNDGGDAVNVPVVYRRVRCFDPDTAPHVTVTPPPFLPPRRSGCDAVP
jgi:hypothetical protein